MRHKAIYATHSNVVSVSDLDGCYDKDGNKVEIDEAKVAQEVKRLEAEYQANQYQRDRLKEYNTIGLGEQLDMIYHDMDAWKARIKSIKDKYKKPE